MLLFKRLKLIRVVFTIKCMQVNQYEGQICLALQE